jgi:acyl-CoA synthetase (AMP-forming)/AMP-acid ligase II
MAPSFRTLVEIVETRARASEQPIAVKLLVPGRSLEEIRYDELSAAAARAAGELADEGVRAGDRVAIVVPTSRSFIDAFFGTLWLGAVPVPIAPPASLGRRELAAWEETLATVARDADAVACLSTSALLAVLRDALAASNPRMRLLGPPSGRGRALAPVAAREEDPALLQYTSGSTSQPKGVLLSHGNLVANARAIQVALAGTPADVTVTWLPLYHDMGLIGGLLTSLHAGCPVVAMSPQSFVKDPSTWLRAMSDHRGTITVAPNFAFAYCAKNIAPEDLDGVRLDALRVIINGAEPIDLGVLERFQRAFEPFGLGRGLMRPAYGLAEGSLAVTLSAGA